MEEDESRTYLVSGSVYELGSFVFTGQVRKVPRGSKQGGRGSCHVDHAS